MLRCIILILFISNSIYAQNTTNKWLLKQGSIEFKSEAPLEIIKAKSTQLKGLILESNLNFAFTVSNNSFEGFNSALQKEHFNENYIESGKFPMSTFKGKIIDDINFNVDGTYDVRVKGKLNIHGVEIERIIKAKIIIKSNKLAIKCSFIIPLSDHDISIPKVVYQKIAEEINIDVNAQFEK